MKILYLHGWNSVVGGVKPTHLRSHGHEVIEPVLDHDDFERALATAQAAFDEHRPDGVVGSTRGGAVAMNLRSDSARPPTPVIRCGGGGVPARHRRAAFRFPPPASSTTCRRWEEVRVGHCRTTNSRSVGSAPENAPPESSRAVLPGGTGV